MSTYPSELNGTWEIDPAHSTIGFAAKHAMVATTRGHFARFTGGAVIDVEAPESTRAWLDIDAASLTTNNEQRDGHLRGPDFFDVENHPSITFRGTSVKIDGETVILSGDLTIAGHSHSVDTVWEFGGIASDPWGSTKAGFDGSATVDRRDWGLRWNAALETGGFLVSDKIKLILEIEAQKVPQA
jgi:polyisoprenoid-binding protein YceI